MSDCIDDYTVQWISIKSAEFYGDSLSLSIAYDLLFFFQIIDAMSALIFRGNHSLFE